MLRAVLVALFTTCCTCCFYLISWSKMTLSSFAVEDALIVFLFTVILPLFRSFFLLVRWISSVFSAAKLDLVLLAHALMHGISSSWSFLIFSLADWRALKAEWQDVGAGIVDAEVAA